MNGIPVSLTNDANAAAVGEMTYGAARGMKNFIMITSARAWARAS
jgi:Transcriptional regulator/sugar kinase